MLDEQLGGQAVTSTMLPNITLEERVVSMANALAERSSRPVTKTAGL